MGGTPLWFPQSPDDGQDRCGSKANIRTVPLIAIYVLYIAWIWPQGVNAAAYGQNIVSSLPGTLGGGVLGSRSGVIQRRDVGNKHLTPTPPGTTVTAGVPANNSFTPQATGDIDEVRASLGPGGSGDGDDVAHNRFLSRVTPPHWAPSDPWLTDPVSFPTSTTLNTERTSTTTITVGSSIIPTNASVSQQTTTSHPTSALLYPLNSTTSSLHSNSEGEIPLRQGEDSDPNSTSVPVPGWTPGSAGYNHTPTALPPLGKYDLTPTPGPPTTVPEWSPGANGYNHTPTVPASLGKDSTTEEDFAQDNRKILYFHFFGSCTFTFSKSNYNSSEPEWVEGIGRRIVFPALLLMSWTFTSVALILHILVPDLRANMGQIFMCYILSIWMKCILTPSSLFVMLCAPDFSIKEDVCIVFAFVSYMMSMAYRFWLNIMCFDIWRKVSHLVRLEHIQPVKLWYYHLYGWGMPAFFGLMALLIREFASDPFIKPGFGTHRSCWFDHTDGEHQLLYMTIPGGVLHIANIIFVVQTRRYCSQMQQTSIPERPESNNNTQGRIHTTTNYINEFNLQFRILNLMVIIWILWSISLAVHWATGMWHFLVIPGLLISLQGVIIFFIFIFNKQKRLLVQRKFPFLKCYKCCIVTDQPKTQTSSSISDTSYDRRKKLSVISVTSLTSLISSRFYSSTNENVAKHNPVREVSSVSSASFTNSSEGGSVNINLTLNRAHILPPIEDAQSLGKVEECSELNLGPSNFHVCRSLSCTSHQPNTVLDEIPNSVPVSRILDEQTENYVDHRHVY
ncbi:unnamed protein product, partial [Meganyctiphanes norvegica]